MIKWTKKSQRIYIITRSTKKINCTLIFPRGLLDAPLILTSTSPGHYTDLSLGTGEMFSEDYEGNNEKWDFDKQAFNPILIFP